MNLPLLLRVLLWPLSMIYAATMWLRAWLYSHDLLKQSRLSASVVSVGNLTMGGTGKTPMVIWLAERFLADGKRVAILSRGYRGSGTTSDEIELMKGRLQGQVLFGVGKDRYSEGKRLESLGVDVFLLDDGFQHLRLARDLDIVLIDSTRPVREEWILPAGRLREPLSALRRAGLVVFTRTEQSQPTVSSIQKFPTLPMYPAFTKLLGFRDHEPGAQMSASCPDPVFAFAGIGNPEAFFADLRSWNVQLVGTRKFRDHHRYTQTDFHELVVKAQSLGAKSLLTTEKDAQNLQAIVLSGMRVQIVVVELEIRDENRFMRDLRERLTLRNGVAA